MADAADKTNRQTGDALPKADPAGLFEGESMNRRRALTVAGQAVGGVAGAIIVLPAVGFALAPIFKKPDEVCGGFLQRRQGVAAVGSGLLARLVRLLERRGDEDVGDLHRRLPRYGAGGVSGRGG